MAWEDPAESDFFQIKNHVGALCLIAVNEYLPSFPTTMGPSQAIRAEIAVVDGPGTGKRYPDALLFNKKLVPQLRNSIGSTILARIGQGKANPGQSAPYILDKAGPGDADKANAWVAANGDIESKPADQSMASSQGYAPDNEQWRVQQARQQQAYPQAGQMPTPPQYPSSYTSVPANQGDEPPF